MLASGDESDSPVRRGSRSRSPAKRNEDDFFTPVETKSAKKTRRRAEREMLEEKQRKEELRFIAAEREKLEKAKGARKAPGKKAASPISTPDDSATRDRVKGSNRELYVACTDLRSGLKKIKAEHGEDVVPVLETVDVPVSECMTVVTEMQRISRDLHGLLLNDLNKVTKCRTSTRR